MTQAAATMIRDLVISALLLATLCAGLEVVSHVWGG